MLYPLSYGGGQEGGYQEVARVPASHEDTTPRAITPAGGTTVSERLSTNLSARTSQHGDAAGAAPEET